MMLYLLKTIACSAAFYALYHFFFSKEKMLVFNRFYLLAIIFVSFILPATTIEIRTKTIPLVADVIQYLPYQEVNENPFTSSEVVSAKPPKINEINWWQLTVIAIYLLGVLYFIAKFLKGIAVLRNLKKNGYLIKTDAAKIVLVQKQIVPFSFLDCIFVNTHEYENGNIDERILQHELVHVQQFHSYDNLFIEIMKIVLWFNPVVFLMSKAVKTNHEFLADDIVATKNGDIANYQKLLLTRVIPSAPPAFVSSFYFQLTKQRLLMLSKSRSMKRSIFKAFLIVPVVLVLFIITSDKSFSQTATPAINGKAIINGPGVSKQELAEFDALVKKYRREFQPGKYSLNFSSITEEDRKKLEETYFRMTKFQQQQRAIGFYKFNPMPKIVPTNKQFQAFKNSSVYGVWIDEKKVPNTELNKYKATDFSSVFISKLYGVAKKGRSYTHQVNMLTNRAFEKVREEESQRKSDYNIMPNFGIVKAAENTEGTLYDEIEGVRFKYDSKTKNTYTIVSLKNKEDVTEDISTPQQKEDIGKKYGLVFRVPSPTPAIK